MLRRRLLLMIASSYRWASSKSRAVLGDWAKPIVTSAVEAESERSTVIRRKAIGRNQPAEVGNAADYNVLGRVANPDVHDAAEGIGLKQLIVRCKSFAYSALEAPGIGGVGVVMLWLAEAVAAASRVANKALKLVVRSSGIGEAADGAEAMSTKAVCCDDDANAVAANGREALSEMLMTISKTVAPISAPVASASSVSGIQNGVCTKPAFWIYPYYEDDMLVIKQAYSATETADRLEVR